MTTLFMILTLVAHASSLDDADSWVGIPTPPFGIDETYRMYDAPNNRNPSLTYCESSGGGYYTHYVDYNNPNATNTNNPYGSPEKPRRTIPNPIPAGSVVEVRGTYKSGGAPYSDSYGFINGQGTEEYPVFVRGVDEPFFNLIMRIDGSYMVIEDVEVTGKFIFFVHDSYPTRDHISIRNNEFHHSGTGSGGIVHVIGAEDIVVYDNYIHHNGYVEQGAGSDVHGIAIASGTRIWVLDNHIAAQDGDALQVGSGQYIYIAGNKMHGDRENAIDLKQCEDVIISQNDIYDYGLYQRIYGNDPNLRTPHSCDGTALLPCNENAKRTWVLFNRIHDAERAIRVEDEETVSDVYIIGNLVHDITKQFVNTYRKQNAYCLFNTIYNCGTGFLASSDSEATGSQYALYNNIFCTVPGTQSTGNPYWVSIGLDSNADNTPIENNLFYDSTGGIKWGKYSTYSTLAAFVAGEPNKCCGCIEANPLFVDPENGDFNLQENSPALTMGMSPDVQAVFDRFYTLYGIDIGFDLTSQVSRIVPLSTAESTESGDTSDTPETETDTQLQDSAEPENLSAEVEDTTTPENTEATATQAVAPESVAKITNRDESGNKGKTKHVFCRLRQLHPYNTAGRRRRAKEYFE